MVAIGWKGEARIGNHKNVMKMNFDLRRWMQIEGLVVWKNNDKNQQPTIAYH
jgi:hypothetical protein